MLSSSFFQRVGPVVIVILSIVENNIFSRIGQKMIYDTN